MSFFLIALKTEELGCTRLELQMKNIPFWLYNADNIKRKRACYERIQNRNRRRTQRRKKDTAVMNAYAEQGCVVFRTEGIGSYLVIIFERDK